MLRRGDGLARAVFRWLGVLSSPSTMSLSSTSTSTAAETARPGHKWDAFLPIPDDPRHLEEERRARAAISAALKEEEEEGEQGEQQQPPLRFTAVPLSPEGDEEDEDDDTDLSLSFSSSLSSSSPPPPPTVPWTARNESDAIPLLPKPVMWLLAEAEKAVANASSAAARLATAAALARINSVAYCGSRASILAWNCSRCRASFAGAFDVEAVVYDKGWDLFAFAGYSKVLRSPVVAFKGTDSRSVYNWAENMRYWRSDLPLPVPGADGSLVHTGFYASWNSSALAPNLTSAAGRLVERFPGRPLYVVGHSLGAALATVAAVDIRARLEAEERRRRKSDGGGGENFRPLDVRLVTFGSPRVGNEAFASFVRQATRLSVRLTHNRDIVPSVPPTWVGFHHVATEAWQVDIVEDRGGAASASRARKGKTKKKGNGGGKGSDVIGVVGLCDASGEDPRCHNSVCYLGLCTSVADHLSYMGAPMLHNQNLGEDAC